MNIEKFLNPIFKSNIKEAYETIVTKDMKYSRFILKEFLKLSITEDVKVFVEKLLKSKGNIVIINDRSCFKTSLFLHTNSLKENLDIFEKSYKNEKVIFILMIPFSYEEWMESCGDLFTDLHSPRLWSENKLKAYKLTNSNKSQKPLTYNLGNEFGEIFNKIKTTVG